MTPDLPPLAYRDRRRPRLPNSRTLADRRENPVLQAFSAAADYDRSAKVQLASATGLASYIAASMPLGGASRICEIGCGTGFLSRALGLQISGGRFLVTDISEAMLERTKTKLNGDIRFDFAVLDGEHPDALVGYSPFDLICSNLAAQWFSNLPLAVERLLKFVAPDGRLVLTTLAQGSLAEWRAAHLDLGLRPGTPDYPSIEALAQSAPAGFEIRIQTMLAIEDFASGAAFVNSLRTLGAQTPAQGHRPLNAGQMRRVLAEFGKRPQITYRIATLTFQRSGRPAGPHRIKH